MSMINKLKVRDHRDAGDVSDQFFRHAEEDQNAIAFIETSDGASITRVVTYGELGSLVRKGARALGQTLATWTDVALIAEPGIDAAIAYLICVTAGCPPVLLPASESSSETDALRPLVAPLASRLAPVATVATPTMLQRLMHGGAMEDWAPTGRVINLEDLVQHPVLSLELMKPRRPTGHSLFTSGSTGSAKRTVLSADAVAFNAAYTADRWEFGSPSRILGLGSPHHSAALMTGYIMPLVRGGSAVLLRADSSIDYASCLLNAVSNFGVTHLPCPDSVIAAVLQLFDPFFGPERHLALQRIIIGGEPLRAETARLLKSRFTEQIRRGLDFRTAYGMTEAAGLITTTSSSTPTSITVPLRDLGKRAVADMDDTLVREVFSSGSPSHGVLVHIEDDQGVRLPSPAVGLVVVETPSIFDAYDASHQDIIALPCPKMRRLLTGDLGMLVDGELYILGRAKESFTVEGRVVFASDVEIIAAEASPHLTGMLGKAAPMRSVGLGDDGMLLVQEAELDSEDEWKGLAFAILDRLSAVWPLIPFTVALVPPGSIPWVATSSKKARIHSGRSFSTGKLAAKFVTHTDHVRSDR